MKVISIFVAVIFFQAGRYDLQPFLILPSSISCRHAGKKNTNEYIRVLPFLLFFDNNTIFANCSTIVHVYSSGHITMSPLLYTRGVCWTKIPNIDNIYHSRSPTIVQIKPPCCQIKPNNSTSLIKFYFKTHLEWFACSIIV